MARLLSLSPGLRQADVGAGVGGLRRSAQLAALAGLIAAGAIMFAALILALGVTGWRELRRQLRRQPA